MANIPRTSLLLCFLVVLYGVKSQASTDAYSVTDYGATTNNGNNKHSFLVAWRAACAASNSTLLFPKGPLLQTLLLEHATNSTVRGLSFVNSRGFHLNFRHSSRVVAEGLHIKAPEDSSNTDGIHVTRSNHVRILHSVIGTGDDCVSVGPGSTDVVVHSLVCRPSHGISIGSLGKNEDEEDVRGLVVRNCTVRGTTNGVRIKTWPGSPPSRASNITFEDITTADVSNPIIIDQRYRYCPHDHYYADKPSLVQISDVTFRKITGTSKTKVAVQLLCSSKRPCTGVRLVDISLTCGNQPCSREIINMQRMPPMPAARLEEEVDVVPGPEQSS